MRSRSRCTGAWLEGWLMAKLKGKEGIRVFLIQNVGKVVTTEQLYKASGEQVQYSRRLRELRDEEGWPIQSHNDDSSLKLNEYRLEFVPDSAHPPEFSRGISAALRYQVLVRDGQACQVCGTAAGDKDVNGKPVRLQVHHVKPKSEGGRDVIENLQTLCSLCNLGAKNVAEPPPTQKRLMAVLRRASRADQNAAYEWLKNRFNK